MLDFSVTWDFRIRFLLNARPYAGHDGDAIIWIYCYVRLLQRNWASRTRDVAYNWGWYSFSRSVRVAADVRAGPLGLRGRSSALVCCCLQRSHRSVLGGPAQAAEGLCSSCLFVSSVGNVVKFILIQLHIIGVYSDVLCLYSSLLLSECACFPAYVTICIYR
jgi:hypothetical protein